MTDEEIIDSRNTLPSPTPEGVISFLSGSFINGIGKVYASRIVENTGLKIIEENFDFKTLFQIPGIPEKNIISLVDSLSGLKLPRKTLALLYSTGLRDADIKKIISHYGSRVEKVIGFDPYDMVENVWKFSFFSADKIGKFIGIKNDDPRRIKGALLTSVKFYAEEGNLFATESQILQTASRITGVEPSKILPEIENLTEEKRLMKNLGGYYLPVYYKAEKEAAKKILHLLDKKEEDQIEYEIPAEDIHGNILSDNQRKAIETVLKNKVTVITGGPGTGKTTALNGIIKLFLDWNKKVILTAPTGRAAKKMSDLTGEEAKTIYRLLGYSMGKGYSHKKFEADLLVIDEASMLEQVLFNHLLKALGDETKVVLVGDIDQLPAIGAGSVLKDMIDSGKIPVVRLDENFRQKKGSLIAENAIKIKNGAIPEKDPAEDFILIEENTTDRIRNRLFSLVSKEIPSYTGIEPKEIQIVTPQQEGPLGAKLLNQELQEILNPDSPELKKGVKKFRLGDRVVQTLNSSERGVFNGETGWISEINPDLKYLTVTFFDGKTSRYGLQDLKELSLSYATTVHKLQGSETDYMILVLSSLHRQLLYRNLLYTGVSRAKKLCVLVGEGKAIELAIATADKSDRNSNFKNLLKKEQTH